PGPGPEPALREYRVRRPRGQGGFGAVFLAESVPACEPVAIKVARPDNPVSSEALIRERSALSPVGPPHVPLVYSRGHLGDGAAYMLMELVRAPLLGDVLA